MCAWSNMLTQLNSCYVYMKEDSEELLNIDERMDRSRSFSTTSTALREDLVTVCIDSLVRPMLLEFVVLVSEYRGVLEMGTIETSFNSLLELVGVLFSNETSDVFSGGEV